MVEIAVAILVGVFGMLAHFWKKKIKSQTVSGLKNYIVSHPGYTVAALGVTVAGALVMAPASIDFSNVTALIAQLTPIFTTGYMVDSAINKAIESS